MTHFDTFSARGVPKPGERGYRPPAKPTDAAWLFANAKRMLNDPQFSAWWQQQNSDLSPGDDEEEADWSTSNLADFLYAPGKTPEERWQFALGLVALVAETQDCWQGLEFGPDISDRELRRLERKGLTPSLRQLYTTARVSRAGALPEWLAIAVLDDILQSDRKLRIVPVSKKEAAAFIETHHSALPYLNPRGLMYAIGLKRGDRLVAVATAGTPTGNWVRERRVAAGDLSVHDVVELTRVASDGTVRGAASMLVSRLLDILPDSRRGVGPPLFITYQLASETGTTYRSLVEKGLRPVAYVEGRLPHGARKGGGNSALSAVHKVRWEAGPLALPADWSLVEAPNKPPQEDPVTPLPEGADRFVNQRLTALSTKLQDKGWSPSRIADAQALARPKIHAELRELFKTIRPRYFSSGSNRSATLRGLADGFAAGRNVHPGITVTECGKPSPKSELCLDAAVDLARTHPDIHLFADSGAYSEVDVSKKGVVTVVRPMGDEAWNMVFRNYDRLAKAYGSRLHAVAPDRVGDQQKTLERMRKYADRVRALARQGVRILAPVQPGGLSLEAFWTEVKKALPGVELEPAFPLKKGVLSPERVVEFVASVKPPRAHLLGVGPNAQSRAKRELPQALAAVHPGLELSRDSVYVRSKVGRQEKTPDPRRPLTRLKDEEVEKQRTDGAFQDLDVDWTDQMYAEIESWCDAKCRRRIADVLALAGEPRRLLLRNPTAWAADADDWGVGALRNEWGRWYLEQKGMDEAERAAVGRLLVDQDVILTEKEARELGKKGASDAAADARWLARSEIGLDDAGLRVAWAEETGEGADDQVLRKLRKLFDIPDPAFSRQVNPNIASARLRAVDVYGSGWSADERDAATRTAEQLRRVPLTQYTDLGRYSDLGPIGSGGYASVKAGLAPDLSMEVAIKRFRPGRSAGGLEAEVRALSQLLHQGIPPILDFDKPANALMLPRLYGGPLVFPARMNNAEQVGVVIQIIDALMYAHGQGWVHGDLKPANVVFDERTGRAVVIDWGLAGRIGELRGAAVGTPGFIDPLSIEPPYAPEAEHDVYGLGATIAAASNGTIESPIVRSKALRLPRHRPSAPLPPWERRALAFRAKDADLLIKGWSSGAGVSKFWAPIVAEMISGDRSERPTLAKVRAELVELYPDASPSRIENPPGWLLPLARAVLGLGTLYEAGTALGSHFGTGT